MKIREPKPNDQEQVQKALDLIKEVANLNPDIEATIWVSACYSCIVSSYINSGITYDEFIRDISNGFKIYKSWWEE